MSPGPWRAEREVDGWEVYDANGDPVATVGCGRDYQDETEAANAAGIAALPDLVALVRDMFSCCGCERERVKAVLERLGVTYDGDR